ncbi:MalY/PatB family protein [Pseudemcibacter aquimaris]|uniref:MalY/PatB family protein n=1 Tax=Pseudemcibacter aquimaris TaxID=2857064 RepID=UPI002010D63F|nr:aminotransferase class I/II-fold pyridoxal phosphate-dependent enzyme [Pseudemcibacter aquimaris]MCC3861037.1 aminotransferase class I/II-fold pyridoxal phosphate-dependent enzyme [Pseudemcibacter aquimaris]WDU59854.1 aminotransferase class I/II-fold pyridoxal phosphate-dependent enzyme [Pseudemcibacter aquimaris]
MKFSRRMFMKGTGTAALLGSAVGTTALTACSQEPQNNNNSTTDGAALSMDNQVNFDAGYDRNNTNSVKFDMIKMLNPGKQLDVGMGIADMDFRTLPQVTSALKKRLETENWGYELPPLDYPSNIVAWNKRRYNADVPQGNILNCVGVLDGVLSILMSFGKEGDEVLLVTPNYSSFFTTIHQANMHEAESEMTKTDNGRWEINWEDFETKLASGIKLFILCNPQNPTGNCWTADELKRMGDLCNQYGCLVIADEIHCDFVMGDNKYVPYADLGEEYAQNSISLKSTSKSFNLAAHRTGYMFSHNREYIDKVLKGGHQRLLLNIMGMIASNEALKHGDDYIDEQNAYLTENMKFAEKFITERIPMVNYQAHEGTYLAFLDCRELATKLDATTKAAELTAYNTENNVTETDFFGVEHIKTYPPGRYMKEWVLDNARIDINPGANYGKGGEGYMRMNLATNRAQLQKALENLEAAVKTL